MNRWRLTFAAALLAAGFQATHAQQTIAQGEKLLAGAEHKATVDGDLTGAIEDYKKIVAGAGADRALAVRALVRMAECYQTMGDVEARKLFEQVVRDYADQKNAVAEARSHLDGASPASGMVSRRVWSGPTVDTYGAVSPDGRSISHVIAKTGALGLYDLATGTDRELVPNANDKDNVEESVISRDSRQVAYSFFNANTDRYELRVANIIGNPNPHRLYDNKEIDWIGPYDWSPDGRWIAVEIKRVDHTAQIGLVSVSDGALRVLKSVDWRGTGRIFFSPDGKYIGYDLPVSDTNRQHNIFALAVDGSRETTVIAHPSLNFMMGWAPGGNLLFASDRIGAMGLWAVAMDDGKAQGVAELLRPAIGWPEPMGVTRSGSLFYSATTLGGEGARIQVGAFDFNSEKTLTPMTDVPHPYGDSLSQPVWSSDGKYLAYLSEHGRAGSSNAQNNGEHLRDSSIVIRSADSGESMRQLQMKLMRVVQIIRWSPDDRSIFLDGEDFRGRGGIFRVDLQTGETLPVTLNPSRNGGHVGDLVRSVGNLVSPLPLALSPDGKYLYTKQWANSDRSAVAFVRRDIASGEAVELLRRPWAAIGAINLSPDGRWIATPSVDEATNSRVMLAIPIAGGEPRVMMAWKSEQPPANLINGYTGPVMWFTGWASDSASLLLTINRRQPSQPNDVWRAKLDGSAPAKVGTNPLLTPHALSPDGKHIATAIAEATMPYTSEVWELENFLPAKSGR